MPQLLLPLVLKPKIGREGNTTTIPSLKLQTHLPPALGSNEFFINLIKLRLYLYDLGQNAKEAETSTLYNAPHSSPYDSILK